MPTFAAFASRIGDLAHSALIDELEAYPKPGLVSPVDSGSHRDMDAGTLRRSAGAIAPFFTELTRAGAAGAPLSELRRIGLAAEAAMLAATGGINAHRGAIFSLGLICAAAGRSGDVDLSAEARAELVGALWGDEIARRPASPVTHGGKASLRYGVGGASAEAASARLLMIRNASSSTRCTRSWPSSWRHSRRSEGMKLSIGQLAGRGARLTGTGAAHSPPGGAGAMRSAEGATSGTGAGMRCDRRAR